MGKDETKTPGDATPADDATPPADTKPPEGSPPPADENRAYQRIVRQVKAEVAKWPPKERSGDRTLHEIARRWAEHKGRKLAAKMPPASPPPEPGSLARVTVRERPDRMFSDLPARGDGADPDPDRDRKPGRPRSLKEV